MTSTTIKCITYNVKGLNAAHKRRSIFNELRLLGPEVVFLQETHISHQSRLRLFSGEYPIWYQGDTISSRTRGVAIGFSKRVRFTLEERSVDSEGRYLFLRGRLNEKEYTLANIYAPNKNPVDYVLKILEKLTAFRKGHLIIMGDFNFCIDPGLDSTARAQGKTSGQLRKFRQKLASLQLVDIWRIHHPKKRDFTFHSPVHGTYSRIDFGLIDHSTIEKVVDSWIGNITHSDHAPMTMEIKISEENRQLGQWRLNEELIRWEDGFNRINKELKNYFVENNTGEISGCTLWQAHKAYIRGVLIELGSRRKKEKSKERQKLIEELASLELKHKTQSGQPSQATYKHLIIKRTELKNLMDQETQAIYRKTLGDRYRWANKPSKHLAKTVQKRKTRNFIEKIQTKDGHIEYSSKKVAEVFKKYYQELYSIPKQGTQLKNSRERNIKYLRKAMLPKITEEERECMETPISEEEVSKAIAGMALGKSPGPDGFTLAYYRSFKEVLIPWLCQYFNGLGKDYEMSKEALKASITILLKEGKEKTLCSSYRPISLLNIDTKLYAKILAERLKGSMNALISPDQVGFIPKREGKDNGVRTLLMLQKTGEGGPPGLLLSIDAEKAFDRVDWGFMFLTLENMGLGPKMIQRIKTLYQYPTAEVGVNGVMSQPFEMANGTRQGCPLSPLLFVLSMEPLLATIRADPEIRGFRFGKDEHKVAAFADDILFYVADPITTLPKLMIALKEYGELSNFQINFAKSEILNINLNKSEIDTLKKEHSFRWTEELKYLGVKLARSNKKTFILNYLPLLDTIRTDCKNYAYKALSWIGRINVIKMFLLPKITYLFQMVPLPLPPYYLRN